MNSFDLLPYSTDLLQKMLKYRTCNPGLVSVSLGAAAGACVDERGGGRDEGWEGRGLGFRV